MTTETAASSPEAPTEYGNADQLLPSDATVLGVDGEKALHFYSNRADKVVVQCYSGAIERREELDGRHLEEWVAYVAEARGWETLNYVSDMSDWLARAITGASAEAE